MDEQTLLYLLYKRIEARNAMYAADVEAWEAEHGPRKAITTIYNPHSLQKIYDEYNADMYELQNEATKLRRNTATK